MMQTKQAVNGNSHKVLVTGGAGFIGATLVRELLHHKYAVTVLDNFATGTQEALSDLPVTLVEGDILDRGLLTEVLADYDTAVHLAADAGVANSLQDPITNAQTNVIGTINVLDALRLSNSDRESQVRFVFVSSNASLGTQPPPAVEDKVPMTLSPYGSAKLAGEAYCHAYHGAWGMGTVALRFANVYGPHSNRKSSVVAKMMSDILRNRFVEIDGDGAQTRDFIHVRDLSRAVLYALATDVGGEVFQIGTARETSIVELAEMLRTIVDIPFEIRYGPGRQADIRRNYSVIEKAKRILDWEPTVQLEEGLRETWSWFKRWHTTHAETY